METSDTLVMKHNIIDGVISETLIVGHCTINKMMNISENQNVAHH